jgi:hypothetical protein
VVPDETLPFPLVSCAPLIKPKSVGFREHTVEMITRDCFEHVNQMMSCDPWDGKHMGSCMLYWGNISESKAKESISKLQKVHPTEFADWCKTPYKICTNDQCPIMAPEGDLGQVSVALCMLASASAITQAWGHLRCKFDSTVEEYVSDGLERAHFEEAPQALDKLSRITSNMSCTLFKVKKKNKALRNGP